MTAYFLRRIASSALLLFLVLSATFVVLQLLPGDPLDRFTDPRIPEEQRQRLREVYGLDKSMFRQYVSWLVALAVRGDWGFSLAYQQPVATVFAQFLPPTLLLTAGAVAFQYPLGLAVGIVAARRRDSPLDHLSRIGALTVYSIPSFWLGLMGLLLFSHLWPILPASGMGSPNVEALPPTRRLFDLLHHLVLPAIVLALPFAAILARFVRNSLLDVLGQDYIRTARARGLSELRVLWIHALRNSIMPVIQIFGLTLPGLLSGVFVIEFVFSWPGLGLATMTAVQSRDYPLVLAITAFAGILVVIGNLVADTLQAVVDPRVRRH